MSAPKRILIATVDYPPIEGGISTLTRETAQALAEQGHEVTVLAPSLPLPLGEGRGEGEHGMDPMQSARDPEQSGGPGSRVRSPSLPLPLGEGRGEGERGMDPMQSARDPEQSGRPGSRVHAPYLGEGGPGGISLVAFPGYRLGILRLFPFLWAGLPLARKHDHILAMNIAYGGVLGCLARTLFGTPYTTYAYAYEFLKFQRVPVLASLIRALYRCSERTVAISSYSRDKLAQFGVPAGRIALAHPGTRQPPPDTADAVEALRHDLAIDDGPVVLSVGRLIPRKRHANLVHAFARVLHDAPDAWLVIAGQGPELSAISRQAFRLGIRDRVVLPGVVDDATLSCLYALCTVFALPCGEEADGQVEGFGLVFTEANAHGKPVVGGRSGGVPDAIVDGETGILVEPDDLDALTDALRRLLTDSALAARLGEQGRARNEADLSWSAFANAAFGILRSESDLQAISGSERGERHGSSPE